MIVFIDSVVKIIVIVLVFYRSSDTFYRYSYYKYANGTVDISTKYNLPNYNATLREKCVKSKICTVKTDVPFI
jgi:hypothetical protein